MTKNYAVIDFGSNSVNLAIYDVSDGSPVRLKKRKSMLGILGYTHKGSITHAGIAKAVEVIAELKKKADNMDVYCFATASLRGVENAQAVTDAVLEETGLIVDIVSWQREAYYDYLSLIHMQKICDAMAVDIGGGSTEIVQIQDSKMTHSASLPVGSLRLYQDHVRGIRADELEISRIDSAVNAYLDELGWVSQTGCDVMHAIGGTARAVVKLHKAVFHSTASKKDYMYSVEDLDVLLKYLSGGSGHYDVITKLMAERIHVIAPGLTELRAIAKRAGVSSIALSKYGVREGYIIEKVLLKGEV